VAQCKSARWSRTARTPLLRSSPESAAYHLLVFETLANQSNALHPHIYICRELRRASSQLASTAVYMHTCHMRSWIHARPHECARTHARSDVYTCISSSHSRHFLLGIPPDNLLKTIACESPAHAAYILSVFS
jgi:hypothetical protein